MAKRLLIFMLLSAAILCASFSFANEKDPVKDLKGKLRLAGVFGNKALLEKLDSKEQKACKEGDSFAGYKVLKVEEGNVQLENALGNKFNLDFKDATLVGGTKDPDPKPDPRQETADATVIGGKARTDLEIALENAEVRILAFDARDYLRMKGVARFDKPKFEFTLKTDKKGEFTKQGIPVDCLENKLVWIVVASKGEAWDVKIFENFEMGKTNDAGEYRLLDTGGVSITVKDEDGSPVDGARVELLLPAGGGSYVPFEAEYLLGSPETEKSLTTPKSGLLELKSLPPREFGFRVKFGGRRSKLNVVGVQPGKTSPLEFVFPVPNLPLHGVAVNMAGKPFEGIVIGLYEDNGGSKGRLVKSMLSNAAGEFRFENAGAGPFVLTATLEGWLENKITGLRPAKEAFEIMMLRASTISVRAFAGAKDEKPVKELEWGLAGIAPGTERLAVSKLRSKAANGFHELKLDSTWLYAQGTYLQLSFRAEGGETRKVELGRLAPGEELSLNIFLDQDGQFVLDASAWKNAGEIFLEGLKDGKDESIREKAMLTRKEAEYLLQGNPELRFNNTMESEFNKALLGKLDETLKAGALKDLVPGRYAPGKRKTYMQKPEWGESRIARPIVKLEDCVFEFRRGEKEYKLEYDLIEVGGRWKIIRFDIKEQ